MRSEVYFEIINGQIVYRGEEHEGYIGPSEVIYDPYLFLVGLRIDKAEALPIFLAAGDDYQALHDKIDQLLGCLRAIEGRCSITAPTPPADQE